MKVNAVTLRVGNVVEHKNRLWVVTKTMHTQPGKGGAFMQCEMKDIRDGTKLNERFRSSEDVERVRLDTKDFQFLFASGDDYTFMDIDNYDQITISSDVLGEDKIFLQDGMNVIINFYDEEIISISLPETVVLTIVEAEPVVKGQTASASFKPAILENGLKIMVPPHVDAGTRVVVNTAERSYVERAKD